MCSVSDSELTPKARVAYLESMGRGSLVKSIGTAWTGREVYRSRESKASLVNGRRSTEDHNAEIF